jgi:hypothetical protein
MKCCSKKHFEVKVKDAHQGQAQSILSKLVAFKAPKPVFADFTAFMGQGQGAKLVYKGPPEPPPNNTSAFIKNCTFRI